MEKSLFLLNAPKAPHSIVPALSAFRTSLMIRNIHAFHHLFCFLNLMDFYHDILFALMLAAQLPRLDLFPNTPVFYYAHPHKGIFRRVRSPPASKLSLRSVRLRPVWIC